VISLLIVLALVSVPLALIARLSLTVVARLLGVVSPSEVTTRAEFARIREQLLATAGDGEWQSGPPTRPADVTAAHGRSAVAEFVPELLERPSGVPEATGERPVLPPEELPLEWRSCPACAAEVPSTASLCLQCGTGLRT
jgi:hypothetical protein